MQGVVQVVAPALFTNYFLTTQMTRWLAKYPKVAIHLHEDPFPQSRIEESDVTFMVVNDSFDASVVARAIARTDYVMCASPGYLQRRGTPDTPMDLQGHQYLRFPWQATSGHGLRHLRLSRLDGSEQAVDVPMQVVFQAESYHTLFTAAVNGAGVAALPKYPASNYFSDGTLVHLLPEWIFDRYTVYVALPTRKLIPARTRAFLDFAAEMVLTPLGPVTSGQFPLDPPAFTTNSLDERQTRKLSAHPKQAGTATGR